MKSKLIFTTLCALAGASRVFAGTIDFEAVPVGQDVGSFYQGATFSGDVVINSSPAFPGTGAHVLDSTGSDIILTFNTLQTQLSFNYTTYFTLVATAYDSHGNVVGTFTGLNNTDLISSGVNALGSINTGVADIASVDFNGVAADYFTLDNISAAGVSGLPNVPDAASTLALFGVAGVGLFAFRRKMAFK